MAISQYLSVLSVTEQYVLVLMDCTAVNTYGGVCKDSGTCFRFKRKQDSFNSQSLFKWQGPGSGKGQVVIGPRYDPLGDVEEGTARAWHALTIAYAKWIARVLAAVHASGNCDVVTGRNH